MTLKPVGDLTIFEVGTLREDIKQALSAHPQVELDLSEIDKLDAAAIQLLIAVRRSEHCALTGITDSIRTRMTDLGA
ncbi:MAG: STAS domain-containing protein [Nitrospira sp. CR1.1]|jgi:anti-anti-sigma regulatory factor|nr:STAS domain-containing protein [Nitrospira sp. CR1.1]